MTLFSLFKTYCHYIFVGILDDGHCMVIGTAYYLMHVKKNNKEQ